MRGETATNEVEADGCGDGVAAAETSGERRPSVVKLQSMLKKVSQSPFHSQYKALVPATSDSSGSSANESRNKQDCNLSTTAAGMTDNQQPHVEQNGLKMDDNHLLAVAKNGVNRGSGRMNPFYTYYLESGSKGHLTEDAGGTPSEVNLDGIFVPPPEFQSSPLELQNEIRSVEDGAELSGPPLQGRFQTSTLAQDPSTNGHFRDIALNSPDLFRPVPAQRRTLSGTLELKGSELIKDEGVNLFQAANGHTREVDLSEKSPSIFADPFRSPSNKEDNLFQSPQPIVSNPFHTAMTNGADLFQTVPTKNGELFQKQDPSTLEDLFGKKNLDIFSPSSANAVDPFPSPITRDLSQDVSGLDDPFGSTPSKQYNPFQDISNGTPDIFQPLPKDVFEITPNSATSVAAYSTPSFNSPSEMKLDTLSSLSDLFKVTLSGSNEAIQPKPPDEIVLTTPQGTKHDILQPTPFTRARNLPMSLGQSPSEMTHVSTFRRPPKPLPRIRPPSKEKPPRPEKPPIPEKLPTPANSVEPVVPKTSPKPAFRPLTKPVIHRKPKTPENKPIEPENYVVLEDILLIGQERCVEDWPEDSPQLDPDFKPSGALRLRRESMKMKADSDGGSGEDQEGSGSPVKKKDKKFKMSLLSRTGSKDKFADDTKEGRSKTLPTPRKSSKEYFSDVHMSAEEFEDTEKNGMDYKKKRLKTKVNQLLRRASTSSSVPERKHMNGHLPQELKDGDLNKKSLRKENSIRRWSEGTVLDNSTGEEEEGAQHDERKKMVKIKFVPQRGFAIMKTDTEPKGAHGYTPRKSPKEKSQDEVYGAHGYTPQKKSQDDGIEDVAQLKGHSLQSTSKARAFMEDEQFPKMHHTSVGLDKDEDPYRMAVCRPKKFKYKCPPPVPPKPKKTNAQWESAKVSHHVLQQAPSDVFDEDILKTGKDSMSPEELYDSEQDDLETCKSAKPSKLKGFKKQKAKNEAMQLECEDPPGVTSGNFLSEAAKAEWLAAQKDEQAMAGLEDEGEDGDTDSLMEWWYTVEQWDELPSDDEDNIIKQDESKSFTILAEKVHRGLRLFNKVFTERAEDLWQSIIRLHAIADDISNFHHKAKIAGITGGTTTAVGGATAIAGLALAPVTLGISLIVTAVGVGVATAGGIASASAAISDNVNNMHDRKKVEMVLEEYEGHLKAIGKILHFVNHGLYKLRGHPFLRSGTQHYSSDWEIRKAVQMISLVDSPVMRAAEITDMATTSVQGLFKGMDKYFIKDSRELKKGCKKEVVAQIKEVANILNDGIVELNVIREELQDATGSI